MTEADKTAHDRERSHDETRVRSRAFRFSLVAGTTLIAFLSVGAQLVHLAAQHRPRALAGVARALSQTVSRPDIVDRHGRLLASDLSLPSLYANPSHVSRADASVDKLRTVLADVDAPALRKKLADRRRKFTWVRRALSPATAQRIHDLGLPGFSFRLEPKRSYPHGRIAGHILGHVNIDNYGTVGVERFIDRHVGVERVVGDPKQADKSVRLSLDVRAQFALEDELQKAIKRYRAKAAAGIIMDANTGVVRAAASLPTVDPADPLQSLQPKYLDRLVRGTYELGSVFKAVTIATALDLKLVTPNSVFDVRKSLRRGRFTINDSHPQKRPISVSDIFVLSSNIGAAKLGTEIGPERQRAYLERLGLISALRTEAGPAGSAQLPRHWGATETMTIAYGHGIAVSPIQFAAGAAALVNGGFLVTPTFLEQNTEIGATARDARNPRSLPRRRVLAQSTSRALRDMMRRNVTDRRGSGRKANIQGYEVGGKTGTADLASRGKYDKQDVITSFFAAFPIFEPRYVVLVTLFRPQARSAAEGRSASANAVPSAGRIIKRIAPLLNVLPSRAESRKL